MRIVAGGISHETSTFAKTPTTLADFAAGFGFFRGPAVIERTSVRLALTNAVLNGFHSTGSTVC